MTPHISSAAAKPESFVGNFDGAGDEKFDVSVGGATMCSALVAFSRGVVSTEAASDGSLVLV